MKDNHRSDGIVMTVPNSSSMKPLKFAPSLIPLILSGEKTSTWRLFDDKDLKVNDFLLMKNSDTGEMFGEAEIIEVYEKKLKDLTEEDWKGHERYSSEEKMYETYRAYYGDRVTPDTIVKIIKFALH
jgi:hypothetical protein